MTTTYSLLLSLQIYKGDPTGPKRHDVIMHRIQLQFSRLFYHLLYTKDTKGQRRCNNRKHKSKRASEREIIVSSLALRVLRVVDKILVKRRKDQHNHFVLPDTLLPSLRPAVKTMLSVHLSPSVYLYLHLCLFSLYYESPDRSTFTSII